MTPRERARREPPAAPASPRRGRTAIRTALLLAAVLPGSVALGQEKKADAPAAAPPAKTPAPAQEGTPAPRTTPEFLADDLVRMPDGTIVRFYQVNYVAAEALKVELAKLGVPGLTLDASGPATTAAALPRDTGSTPKTAIGAVQNVLRIQVPEVQWPTVERYLAILDRPQPQVRVDARVMELTFDDQLKLGMTSKVTRPVGDTFLQSFEAKFPNTLDASSGSTAVFKETDKFVVFDYALQAVEQGARADVLSQPSILASQGEIAVIRAGDQEPYVRQNLSGNTVQATTEFKDVGIRLEVQPILIGRDAIRVRILAESSRLSDFRVTATSANQTVVNPVVSQRTADTVVTVPNGETLVIGGLEVTETRDTKTGLPFLQDLPLIGWVFGSTSKRNIRATISFWITLTIERPEEARLFVPKSERERLDKIEEKK